MMFEKIEKIRAAFDDALEDDTYMDRYQAAFNVADATALGIVWRKYGITRPIDGTAEMRRLATRMRRAAIGF